MNDTKKKLLGKYIKALKKKLIQNTVSITPKKLLHSMIVKNLNLTEKPIEGITFSLASTKQELEQAFHLLYKCYLNEGLMEENKAQLRVTPYHALPTTSTLIGKIGEKVIVTVSIVKRSNFGIPLDNVIDLNSLPISSQDSIGEVSALAIHKDYRGQASQILFPMIKFMYHYTQKYLHLNYYIIGVHPKWFSFYEIIFGYNKIEHGTMENYSFVNDAPLQIGYINVKDAYFYLAEISHSNNDNKNLFKYFMNTKEDIYHYPERRIQKSFDFVMNIELFLYFFTKKTDILKNFTNEQYEIINNLFYNSVQNSNCHLNEKNNFKTPKIRRSSYRAPVQFDARFYYINDFFADSYIRDVSQGGFSIYLNEGPQKNLTYKVKISSEKFVLIDVVAEFVGEREVGVYGFKIVTQNPQWTSMINEITAGIDYFPLNKKKIKTKLKKVS